MATICSKCMFSLDIMISQSIQRLFWWLVTSQFLQCSSFSFTKSIKWRRREWCARKPCSTKYIKTFSRVIPQLQVENRMNSFSSLWFLRFTRIYSKCLTKNSFKPKLRNRSRQLKLKANRRIIFFLNGWTCNEKTQFQNKSLIHSVAVLFIMFSNKYLIRAIKRMFRRAKKRNRMTNKKEMKEILKLMTTASVSHFYMMRMMTDLELNSKHSFYMGDLLDVIKL